MDISAPGTGTIPSDADAAVRIRGLRKDYGRLAAVDGIDLDIAHGETFALLGPNGAGKSTTVEILEGYRLRSSGEVSVLGVDPAHGNLAWKARIGIVLQSATEPGTATVREQLAHFAGFYPDPLDVDEVIAAVGLEEKARTRVSKLSGGQRRRVDVALGIIGRPELLFLDEPTTGFDPSARRAAWELVDSLRAGGTTILLTTHYMEEAERLADRIVVLRDGEVVGSGTPRTLGGRDRAQSEIVFALPGGLARGDLPVELAARARMTPGGRFSVPSPDAAADLYALSGWAVAQGVPLAELEVRRPTLEDVYLELTR